MNTFDENNWEDHWRKEIGGYSSLPSNEDWHGMNRLLNQKTSADAQHIIEQGPIGSKRRTINKRKFPRVGWPIWIAFLLLVIPFGMWIASVTGEAAHHEMEAITLARDTFPPLYILNRYWTYDQEGNRIGEMHSDTIWLDHTVRKRGVHILLSPGEVSDYRIDTVFHISGRGLLQSVGYDTIDPSQSRRQSPVYNGEDQHLIDDCERGITYHVDTIYLLDSLGNLTDSIFSIDSTIRYSPIGKI